MPGASRSLKEQFLAALAVTPAERSSWLEHACGQDAELRRRVERMLAAHDTPQSLLDRMAPAAEPPEGATGAIAGAGADGASTAGAEQPGTVIAGRYKLVEEIGEGGMGTVWMAQQTEPVKRLVALKVIKAGMDSKQVLARFEAERQALALMDHPNIARVLDAGTIGGEPGAPSPTSPQVPGVGRPYFVMELVKGVPITRYCDEHRLTLRERLGLFVLVCQAVQHAHQKGIIHRDLKPSNVMVCLCDGRPVPKVIDFGVAKATGLKLTEKTLFTEFGQVVGTLEYMSPEQAQLNQFDIDTRSDIYALGVLLYELLTGTTPLERKRFEASAFLEVLRLIREEESPRPSTRLSTTEGLPAIAANRSLEPKKLSGLLRGELDWIVMKSLEKDRNRRYETANGLAQDVRCYLNDEHVQACPPSAWYRLRKFARRNRGPVLAGGLLLLALLLGIIGTTVGLVRAEQARQVEVEQRQRAERARTAEARQRLLAEGERDEKEKARAAEVKAAAEERKAKEMAQRRLVQIEKANEILASIFRDLNPRLEEKGGPPLLAQLGERLEEAALLLEGEAVGDLLAVARLQLPLASALLNLGNFDAAIALFGKARQTLAAALGADHPDTLACMNNLGVAYHLNGQLDQALPLLEETLAKRKIWMEPDHPETLTTMNNLALAYRAAGRMSKALSLHQETLVKTNASLGPDHAATLHSMGNLAAAYHAAGQVARALPLFEETLVKMNAKLGPDHAATLSCMSNLAAAYQAAGRLGKALQMHEETLAKRMAKFGPDHPDTLISMNNLGGAHRDAGRMSVALPLFEETLKKMKAKLGADHPYTLSSMNNLAATYQATGQPAKALALFEETLEKRKAKFGPHHPQTLLSMNNLAGAYQTDGQLVKALPLFEETLTKRKVHLGANHPETLNSMNNLALAYRADGQAAKALALFQETLEKMKAHLDADHPHALNCMNNLARTYIAAERHADAEPLLAEWLQLKRPKLPADSLDVASILKLLGECRVLLKKYAEAETPLRDSLAIYRKTLPNAVGRYRAASLLGAALAGRKKFADAEPLLLDSAKTLMAQGANLSPANRQQMLAAVQRVIDLYDAWERPDDAAKWRRQLEDLKNPPKR